MASTLALAVTIPGAARTQEGSEAGASDMNRRRSLATNLTHFAVLTLGLAALLAIRRMFRH